MSDLNQLRREWHLTIDGDGGRCPCCDRWGKIYSYRLTGSMAATLRWLCEQSPTGEWINMPENGPRWALRGYQFATLEKWGLLERNSLSKKEAEEADVKHSGFWRPTENGRKFDEGALAVPKIAFIYNNAVLRFSEQLVFFNDCLGKKFSYLATMGAKLPDVEEEDE